MNTDDYLLFLENAYSKHFTVEKDTQVMDLPIDIYARFSHVGGRTFVTQKDIIDKFETNEFCFVKSFSELNIDNINIFLTFLKMTAEKIVNPGRDHKCSYITGVIVSNGTVDTDIIKIISKFKYTKPYLFYFHGWSDIRLIIVDLKNNSVYTNSEGKKVKKVYQPTLLNK